MRAIAAAGALALLAVAAATAPERTDTSTVSFVTAGRSDWRVVCPPPASPAIRWAATELQRYLQQMSGCKLPVAKRVRGKPAVAIGLRPELSPEDRAVLPPPAQGYDGYAVAVVPGTRKITRAHRDCRRQRTRGDLRRRMTCSSGWAAGGSTRRRMPRTRRSCRGSAR